MCLRNGIGLVHVWSGKSPAKTVKKVKWIENIKRATVVIFSGIDLIFL